MDGADLRRIMEITAITHKESNGYAFSQCKFKITNSLYKLVPCRAFIKVVKISNCSQQPKRSHYRFWD